MLLAGLAASAVSNVNGDTGIADVAGPPSIAAACGHPLNIHACTAAAVGAGSLEEAHAILLEVFRREFPQVSDRLLIETITTESLLLCRMSERDRVDVEGCEMDLGMAASMADEFDAAPPVEVVPQVVYVRDQGMSYAPSGDGRYGVSAEPPDDEEPGYLRLWDMSTGRLIRRIAPLSPFGGFSSPHLLSGNSTIAAIHEPSEYGGDEQLFFWDVLTGLPRFWGAEYEARRKELELPAAYAGASADGSILVTGTPDGRIQVWDLATGLPGQALGTPLKGDVFVEELQVSPDGAIAVATLSDGSARAYDLAANDWQPVTRAAADGFLEALAETDPPVEASMMGSAAQTAPVFKIAVSADTNAALLTIGNGNIVTWDVADAKVAGHFSTAALEHSLSDWPYIGAVRPINEAGTDFLALLGDGTVERRQEGQEPHLFEAEPVEEDNPYGVGLGVLAAAPDGTFFVRSRPDRFEVVSLPSGETTLTIPASLPIHADVSSDGRLLVGVASWNVRLIDLGTGEEMSRFAMSEEVFYGPETTTVYFVSSNTGVLAVRPGDATVYDLEGNPIRSFERGFAYSQQVGVSASTEALVLAGGWGGRYATIYDLTTGQTKATLVGHTAEIVATGFMDDGRLAITTSLDGTTRIWDAATGEQLLLLVIGTSPDDWLALTPAGFFSVGGQGAKFLAVVDGLSAYGVEQFYDALYRPDLVQALLAGDPALEYADAAAELNLRSILDSGTLPEISVVSNEVVGDQLRIIAELTAQNGGGIGDVTVSVRGEDGQRATQRAYVPSAARGKALVANALCEHAAAGVECLRIDRVVPLESGRNVISIVAYNGANLLATDPLLIEVDAGEVVVPRGDLYVLALGVNDYAAGGVRGLSSAVADAEAVAGTLSQMRDPELYESVHVEVLRNGEVTRENLDRVFTRLGGIIRPEDKFVFFVAGHGTTRAGRYYFFPQDFTYDNGGSIAADAIDQDEWNLWFDRIKARASLLLYDTCEAGTIARNDDLAKEGALRRMITAMGRNVITASSAEQVAMESRGHGLFTRVLLEAFSASQNNSGDPWVDVTDLQRYVEDRVPSLSREWYGSAQDPTISIQANFPIGRVASLGADDLDATLPVAPTHFVALPEGVDVIDASGAVLAHLEPDEGVRVLEEVGYGLVRIARDGVELGVVPRASLQPQN